MTQKLKYCRACIRTSKGKKWVWGRDFKKFGKRFRFEECNKEGDGKGELIFGSGTDLVSVKEAAINLTSGNLEVVTSGDG